MRYGKLGYVKRDYQARKMVRKALILNAIS
jgi:hypothetical protein